MKRVFLGMVMVLLPFIVFSQNIIGIDEAIENSAGTIKQRLNAREEIAVYKFGSTSAQLSNYVVDKLTSDLINAGIAVVDRKNTDSILREKVNYQSTGMVSDESAVHWGKELGAKCIVIGSIEELKNYHIIRFRVINVETTRVVANPMYNVKKDAYIKNLINAEKKSDPRFSTAALNLAFGLGSYMQGDWVGGLVVTGGYVLGVGLIFLELGLKYEDALAGYLGPIGIGVCGLSMLFGIVRPFIYSGNPRLAYIANGIDLAVVPDYKNNMAVKMSYTVHF
jgi:TolB-like protein